MRTLNVYVSRVKKGDLKPTSLRVRKLYKESLGKNVYTTFILYRIKVKRATRNRLVKHNNYNIIYSTITQL